jgi:OOP family OmpA-OmpF porin
MRLHRAPNPEVDMVARKTWALLAIVAASVFASVPATAQVSGVHLTLSPYAGAARWSQRLALKKSVRFGGSVGLMFGSHLGVEGIYGYSPTKADSTPSADIKTHHVGADAILLLAPEWPIVPYVLGGWTQVTFDPADPALGEKQTFHGWEGGGGFIIPVADHFALRLEARDVTFKRDPPFPNTDKWNHNVFVSGGFQVALGGHVKDSDRDGVSDRHDKCPDTPIGATVDENGCPKDSDGDGVYDGLDRCAGTPTGAKVDAQGCPVDSDGDGVPDGIDQCANTPKGATVDAKGCPVDSDGDGVPDGIDQCASTPAGATVEAKGCPIDSDGDGVPDGIDKCPNTTKDVRVDSNGCPIEVNEKETQLLDTGMIRLNDVNFETGKAELKPESFAVLDQVGQILSNWPQLKIEIGGHTDSRGSAKMNLDLSQRRAQAVLDYLKSKFPNIDTNQYTAKGYGESQPIADNSTVLGRAKNRRVEFKVLNRDVLRKEIEQRKLLKK